MKDIVIIGAGGHAKVILDILLKRKNENWKRKTQTGIRRKSRNAGTEREWGIHRENT